MLRLIRCHGNAGQRSKNILCNMSDTNSPSFIENDGPLQSRPVSRRGSKDPKAQRSTSSADMQTGRPISTKLGMRPPSTQSGFKRTASRLSSGAIQPPKTGQSVLGISNINLMERPITQQGVSGLRTATSRGPQFRQVLDNRYYEGLLRMKMKEIASEVARLNAENDSEEQQQAASQIYEKRVRETASELTKLQAQLADYNLVVDKVNTGMDKAQIDAEAEELKRENDRVAEEVDKLFAQNRMKEELLQQLEKEIENEKNITNKLIQEMNEADRMKYEELSATNEQLQREINQFQQQLDILTERKLEYEDRISGSQIRQETVRLYHKLREREERKEALLEEERNRSTPAQEREKLLQRVKEDNAEIAAIERQITEINEQMKKKKEELELIEQDLEESQSDRHQKFKELKKREETMEQFLSTFEENKKNEVKRVEELEEKIVKALQQMSKNLSGNLKFPSREEFFLMKDNLVMNQEESEKSKMTLEELNKKQAQLAENMKKVDDLENKIQKEMDTIREKSAMMKEEMKIFVDLDRLRDNAQERRDTLMSEREKLLSKLNSLEDIKRELEKENKKLMKELNDNETYIQLSNLEKKLQVLEQSNKSTREFIDSKKQEMNYEAFKRNALDILKEYNQILVAGLSK